MGEVVLSILDIKSDDVDDNIDFSEKRFLIDDLNTLVDYGFLIRYSNQKGEDVYIITRNGEDFIKLHQA